MNQQEHFADMAKAIIDSTLHIVLGTADESGTLGFARLLHSYKIQGVLLDFFSGWVLDPHTSPDRRAPVTISVTV